MNDIVPLVRRIVLHFGNLQFDAHVGLKTGRIEADYTYQMCWIAPTTSAIRSLCTVGENRKEVIVLQILYRGGTRIVHFIGPGGFLVGEFSETDVHFTTGVLGCSVNPDGDA